MFGFGQDLFASAGTTSVLRWRETYRIRGCLLEGKALQMVKRRTDRDVHSESGCIRPWRSSHNIHPSPAYRPLYVADAHIGHTYLLASHRQ